MGQTGHPPATSARRNPFDSLFPESRIASFTHRSHRFVFFSIVSELIRPSDVVLDYGAGRGSQADIGGPHLRATSTLQGRVARVIGVDVDPTVLDNPVLDERHVIKPGERLPLADNSVDLIYSFAVLEHVTDAPMIAAEFDRVLKPGGWICAWTPNKWGYIAIGARLVPSSLHGKVLRFVDPIGRGDKDVFPTLYQMNSLRQIRGLFPAARFDNYSFGFNAQPSYHFGQVLVARFWMLYMALLPRSLAQSLMIFLKKR